MRVGLGSISMIAMLVSATAAFAQDGPTGWQGGAVLDLTAQTRALAAGQRDRGLALGHSDLSAHGPLGRHLQAHVTAALHSHERKAELALEEAWIQTRTLPLGLQLRAGRFASQLGYLNEQHPHADDFVERPLLYRAFVGGHWNDDGLRLNWVAPTEVYLRVGAEVFRGKRLIEDAVRDARPGAMVLSARLGSDIGRSQSWQAGLSLLHNRREAAGDSEPGEEGGHDHGHDHDHAGHTHAHGAAFSGRRLWLGELAWKWAPDGNNARQQVRVVYERALVRGLGRHASRGDRHVADYLGVVWRFAPAWEIGARADALRVRIPHGDHFHDGRLREAALMLAYKPTHQQTLRLQATQQRSRAGFDTATHSLQLQYILGVGAHAAHSF